MGTRTLNWPAFPASAATRHSILFYSAGTFPSQKIAENIGQGIVMGESAFLVMEPEHLEEVTDSLERLNFNIKQLRNNGELGSVDAKQCLGSITHMGRLNREKAFSVLGGIVHETLAGVVAKKVRLTGEMVSILVEDGHAGEAVALEECWNRVLERHDANFRFHTKNPALPTGFAQKLYRAVRGARRGCAQRPVRRTNR